MLRTLAMVFALAAGSVDATGLFVVNQPWVRPARAGQNTEAFMDLTSTAGATLVDVESPAAAGATLRGPQGTRATGAASVDPIALPAGRLVALAPGGYRVALRAVTRTLKLGERVTMTLTIVYDDGSRASIPVDAEVRLRSPIDDERRAHAHTPHRP
ncbi:MAG: copper chaperone PCu(A)C [Betaproteobacteria bacterium]